MKTENIPSMDEIIFEKRNKEYGAYVIRQSYTDNVVKGVMIMSLLVSLFLVLTAFLKSPETPVSPAKTGDKPLSLGDPNISIIPEVKVKAKLVSSSNRIPTRVVKTEVVELPDPPVEEPITDSGGSENGSATGVEGGSDTGSEEGTLHGDGGVGVPVEPAVFVVAEEMPYFEGGMAQLYRYLERKMRYPSSARHQHIEGTVYVSFVVGPNGEIKDVHLLKGFHKDCDLEAKRVIEGMPRWVPGRQQKRPVSVRMVVPIKFALAKV